MSDKKHQEPFKLNIKTTGSRAVMSRTPTIEDIFGSDGGRLLQERNYHEAYVTSCRRMKLDPAAIGPKDLVNHYRCCMLARETEEAIRIKEQLNTFIKEKYETTPDRIRTFADTFWGEWRNMEAILFYQIAAEFYGNQTKAGLVGIKNCAGGIKESVEAMLLRDEGLKPIVRNHVIPLMRDMREMIRRSNGVSEEDRCLQEVQCLHYIEYIQSLVGDIDVCQNTCKEAIAMLERVFKERAKKYVVYGGCWHNLGAAYGNTSRPNDAYQCFRKAIAAYRKAEDINDDKRAKKIARSKENLEQVRKELQLSPSELALSFQDMQINPQDHQQPAQPKTQIGKDTGSNIAPGSYPCGDCALCGNRGECMVTRTGILKTPKRGTISLTQVLDCKSDGIYVATCKICGEQYVGQTVTSFSDHWTNQRKCFNATGILKKLALPWHYAKKHETNFKSNSSPDIEECYSVTFVEQPTTDELLDDCKEKWYEATGATINIKIPC